MSKPSWKDAPEWANWLAQDDGGGWYWYESEPKVDADWGCFESRNPTFEQTRFAGGFHGNDNWRDTLEQRLTPRSLGCFNKVAGVIGEDAAEHELQRVIDCEFVGGIYLESDNSDLMSCFTWKDSPQGEDFWSDVNRGRVPQQFQVTHWDGNACPIPAGQVCVIQGPSVGMKGAANVEQRLTPRSLGFFNQVAGVIGEDAAEHELQRVIDCGIVRKECVGATEYELRQVIDCGIVRKECVGSTDVGLKHCFLWKDSPQGGEFWYEVNRGRVPQQLREWDGNTWPIPAGQVCVIQSSPIGMDRTVTVDYMDETHCIWHEEGSEQTNYSYMKYLTFKPVKSEVQKARKEILDKLEDFTGNDYSALSRAAVVEFVLSVIEGK